MLEAYREAWRGDDSITEVSSLSLSRTAWVMGAVLAVIATIQLGSASGLIGRSAACGALVSAIIALILQRKPAFAMYAAHALVGVLFAFGSTVGWLTASSAVGMLFFVALVPVIALHAIGLRAAVGWGLATLALLALLGWQRTASVAVASAAFDPEAMGASPHRAAAIFLVALLAVIVTSDVARRRAAEQAQRLQHDRARLDQELVVASERYRALIENSPDVILELDQDSGVVFASPNAREIFEMDRLLGSAITDLFSAEDREEVRAQVEQVIADRNFALLPETRLETEDGKSVWVETTVSRYQKEGEIRVVLRLRDVTAPRELQRRLQQSQKLQAIGEMAGGIAHDFNNLLTVIISWADGIQADPGIAVEASQEILVNAERGAALIRQLLAFARESAYAPRVVDVNLVILELAGTFDRLVDDTVEITMDLAEPLPNAVVDPKMVEQTLINLVLNARDAMPRGGRIEVRSRRISAPETDEGERVIIEVCDQGAGMSEEIASRAFEPFFTTKEVGEGTGLGLAAVHGLTERMGGRVSLETEPGRGTIVRLQYLATSREAQPVSVLPETKRKAEATSHRILVVDDEGAILEVVRLMLTSAGYVVETAADGLGAIERCQNEGAGFDMVVCDVMMPRMTGPEMFRRLRAESPDLKALFISGYSRDRIDDLAQEGATFLSKPFRARQLIAAVRSQLEGSGR